MLVSAYHWLAVIGLIGIPVLAALHILRGVVGLVGRFQINREERRFNEFQEQVPEVYRVPTNGDPTAPNEGLSGIVENWRRGMGS